MKKECFILITIFTLACFVKANSYSEEMESAYNYAYNHGITTTKSIDNAGIYSELNRISMAKMISNFAINVLGLKPDYSLNCTFDDVSANKDAQYDYGVTKACQLGLMGIGDDGKTSEFFNPNGIVTRGQRATAFSRALSKANGETVKEGEPYYRNHMKYLNSKGIIKDINNPTYNTKELRGNVMIMMKRTSDTFNPTNNKPLIIPEKNTSEQKNNVILSDEELIRIIANDLNCNVKDIEGNGHSCMNDNCEYMYSAKANGGTYKYKINSYGEIIEKLQDIGIEACKNIAKSDANINGNDIDVQEGYGYNTYYFTFILSDKTLVYDVSIDGTIKNKQTLISADTALKNILNYLGITNNFSDIKKSNDKICSLRDELYECDFSYGGSKYLSYIDATNGTLIPIKKSGNSVSWGNSIKGGENVIISTDYSNLEYISSDEALQLVLDKINKSEQDVKGSSIGTEGEGYNKIYAITLMFHNEDNKLDWNTANTYYVDAIKGSWITSKYEFISTIAVDAGVDEELIKETLQNVDDSDDFMNGSNLIDNNTQHIITLYGFSDNDYTYLYVIDINDGKILDKSKTYDIGEDKAISIAKDSIKKDFNKDFSDEDAQTHYNSPLYTSYLKYSGDDEVGESFKTPQYVISFLDESDNDEFYNIYRAKISLDGKSIKTDSFVTDDMFLGMMIIYGAEQEEMSSLYNAEGSLGVSFSI